MQGKVHSWIERGSGFQGFKRILSHLTQRSCDQTFVVLNQSALSGDTTPGGPNNGVHSLLSRKLEYLFVASQDRNSWSRRVANQQYWCEWTQSLGRAQQ